MLKPFKAVMAVLLMLCAAGVGKCRAWTVDLETGLVIPGYNDVQVPKKTGTRFSLSDDFKIDSKAFYRLRVTQEVAKSHFVSFLYAPLTLDAKGVTKAAISFNNDTFPADTAVTGKYRFDSYRVSYWKSFEKRGAWTTKLGFTAKIRDAAISLSGNGITSEKKNTGFVPLLNFGARYTFSEKLSAVFDADALAGGPGRAEDVLLAAEYNTCPRSSLRLGYRIVEGGADVDEVYNFALLNYLVAGFTYSF